MEARKSITSFTGRRRLQNDSTHRLPAPLQTEISRRFSTLKTASPPDTPLKSPTYQQHPNGGGDDDDDQALFHNYLRAFCEFEPPTTVDDSDDALLLTVHIRPGDLVLVHSVHANGWADGTVLTTNVRGWLPTNYCETFDHPYMRNLLNAMTQFWDLLGANEDGNLSTFVRQDYVRPLIAGVRYLLEHADCLHREAALVQRSAGLRRLRKGLLADLSMLVSLAKRLQEMIGESIAGQGIDALMDDLMAKACKVVTRAIGFVDMLAHEGAGVQPLGQSRHLREVSKGSISNQSASIPEAGALRESSDRIDSARRFSSAVDDSVDRQSMRSRRTRPQSGKASHRLSTVSRDLPSQSGTLASQQLAQAHDLCISHIGGFIGLYLHPSSPASELLAMTQHLLEACSAVLEVVDKIAAYDVRECTSLQQARRGFELKIDELTTSTEELVSNVDSLDDDIVMEPERTSHLVHLGTSLIRTVGDCVVRVRKVIERIGDFDLENPPSDGNESSRESHALPGASSVEDYADEHQSHHLSENEEGAARTIRSPSPQTRVQYVATTDVADFAPLPPAVTLSPKSSTFQTSHHSLSIPEHGEVIEEHVDDLNGDAFKSLRSSRAQSGSPSRKCSLGASISNSTDTRLSSVRDSSITAVSEVSTRATTPDQGNKEATEKQKGLTNSFASLSSIRSTATADASIDGEAQLLQQTYANELTLNKDGQVTGGSLPALVEQLTTGDNAPDLQFVTAFLVTFRSFTTPRELAQALIHRFDYVGDDRTVGVPVRLRVYNAFKNWLENYWNADLDKDALGEIRFFALHKLKPVMDAAGERLLDLVRQLSALYQSGTASSHLISTVGTIRTAVASPGEIDRNAPEPIITKSQLAALRKALNAEGKDTCSVVDFDPLELARQLTVLASRIFCEIQAEELISLEWNKKEPGKAENVRSMCVLNTDVAHVVGDTILSPEDAKKRAIVIKHWSKVASRCLELNNYESLMAIMCSLNSSVVQRLKRTWEIVSKKTKARLDELNTVVDFSRNQTSLRRRLENAPTPCLPFLGIYLTDLTMVDAGNPKLRELRHAPTDAGESLSVINFDKHMRMAKIVAQLQHFQVPYRLKEIPEMQSWLRTHLERMRGQNSQMVGDFHRRSLWLEPKRDVDAKIPDLRQALETSMLEDGNMLEGGAERRATEPSVSDARTVFTARPKTSHTAAPTVKSFKSRGGQTFDFLLKSGFPFQRGQQQQAPPPPLPEMAAGSPVAAGEGELLK